MVSARILSQMDVKHVCMYKEEEEEQEKKKEN
jgi:hypothetical protein